MSDTRRTADPYTLPVYAGGDFVVSSGVAEGEGISFADELVLDDTYQLARTATRLPLTVLIEEGTGAMTVARKSDTATSGNTVVIDCCLTFMAADSSTCEALVLVEVADGTVEDIFLLPLGSMPHAEDLRLVGVDRDGGAAKFGEMACVSFVRGTHITMASGEQRRIEDLQVGDRVLTRDDGAQTIRWIGQHTQRATGDMAPVVIKAGTLHNTNDLVLSPDHRIFVYQREDRVGAGRAEILIRVRHLLNGTTVYQQDGGYVDYFQIVFDNHEIIYAEGIAAESLLADRRTRHAIPDFVDVSKHNQRALVEFEFDDVTPNSRHTADLLRKASSS